MSIFGNLRLFALVACVMLPCCAGQSPYFTSSGTLAGGTMSLHSLGGDVNVYPPKAGEPHTQFTVELTARNATTPPAPTVRRAENTVLVDVPGTSGAPIAALLRAPDGVAVRVTSDDGNIGVTNVTGPVDAHTNRGDISIMVPGYAQASVGEGNINVTDGAQTWPGTLVYSADRGDVVIYVLETAKFHIHMETANGTLFDEFGLRGSANGARETIDGDVNGGGAARVDIRVNRGNIRVLRLAPQA